MVLIYPVGFWQQRNQDPFVNNVVLFLKGEGTNGSTTIIDSSPSPKTCSVGGSAVISTAQAKYGSSSIFIPGGSSNWVLANSSSFNDLGSVWTIEGWFFPTDLSAIRGLFISGNLSSNENRIQCGFNGANNTPSQTLRTFIRNNTTDIISGGWLDTITQATLNQWNHTSVCRNGSTIYTSINGIVESKSISGSVTTGNNCYLGVYRANSTTYSLSGYASHFRITKTVARYTANFNPETDTYLN